jgi:hypothetical protein
MGGGIDAQAQAHYNRVIADGGLIPSGLVGVNNFFKTVKGIYGTSDITTAISVGLDAQVLGYKLGAGAGTTAGQAAQKLYSCSGASGDVVQTTAASQPLLLVHEGANYWWGSSVDGNTCTTPNSTALTNITGDLEVIVKCFIPTSTSALNYIFGYSDASSPRFGISFVAGTRQFRLIGGGSVFNSISESLPNNYDGWIKFTRVQSTGVFNVFTSSDGITYTLLGTNTGSTAAFSGSTNLLTIGDYNNAGASVTVFTGKIYSLTISNSIGGAPVVDFNPNQYNAATSQTQWTSSTGEVWTINTGTATSGYKGVLVDRTIVQGDGVDDGLTTSATINMPTVLTIYGAIKGYNNEEGSGKSLFGKSNIDGNVFRKSATELGGWIGNAGLAYYGVLANVTNLNLVTFKRKVSDNVLQANNGSIVNNTNSSAIVNSTISMFSVTTFGSSNGIVNTGVISFIEDNSTQKTSMYNYIKSINNNAF